MKAELIEIVRKRLQVNEELATILVEPLDAKADTKLKTPDKLDKDDPRRYLNSRQVEPMLAYATRLLDRCYSYWTEKQNLEVRALEYAIQDAFDAALEQCVADEVSIGGLDLAALIASLEADGATEARNAHQSAVVKLAEFMRRRRKDDPDFGTYYYQWKLDYMTGGNDHNHASNLLNYEMRDDEILAERDSLGAGAAVEDHNARANVATARRNFETQLKPIQMARLGAAKERLRLRREAALLADGAMNFAQRAKRTYDLFWRDWQDAYIYLQTIERGLRNVYGIRAALAPLAATGSFYAHVDWAKRVAFNLLRFARGESDFVVTFSLRDALGMPGDAQWNALLAGGTLQFPTPPTLFSRLTFVRLRGVRGFLRLRANADPSTTLRIQLQPPVDALAIHGLAPADIVEVKQEATVADLGSCGTRSADRGDVPFAGDHLYNTSPISNDSPAKDSSWRVSVHALSAGALASVGDIEIDLHTAALTSA